MPRRCARRRRSALAFTLGSSSQGLPKRRFISRYLPIATPRKATDFAARAQGIGLGWISILDPAAIATILDVPPTWKLIGYFCLGYPEADASVPELEQAGWQERVPISSAIIRR